MNQRRWMVVLASAIVIGLMVAIGACSDDSNDHGSTAANTKGATTATVARPQEQKNQPPAKKKKKNTAKSVTVPMLRRKGAGPINGKVTLSKLRGSHRLRLGITVSVPTRRYGIVLFARGKR